MSAENDADDAIEESQSEMIQAIYEHSMAIVRRELMQYTDWLVTQGVMKHRGATEFSASIKVDEYVKQFWTDQT